ncbi:MAG: carboxypeptidase-like regulatory domain-containing protein, partial [Bacteroidota bacterium]|nr:carboxypeptidase-like regulatory domain-containing protein [Bacteroidota bacterium]
MYPRQIKYIFVFFLLSFVFTIHAQDLNKSITLHVENQPLKEVLNRISAQSGVHFSYSTQLIDTEINITYKAVDKPIREVLEEVLTPNGIAWKEVEGHVVLRPMRQDEIPDEAPRINIYTLSGNVREKSTGEALIGANVYVPGINYGAITNAYGFYSLSLPEGKHVVIHSFIGFAGDTTHITLDQNKQLSVNLGGMSLGITEVIIRASEEGSVPGIDQLGDFRMTGRTLSRLPGFAGEVDVIKALQTLPGISSFGDGSSFFFVRGGKHDQNLMMIDEAPIYNPSHLFGFFSVITPDAINEMKIYKGDFPSRYGGRTSSVIDITAREGNQKRFGFGGNIGIYASSLTVEGPFKKEKASFIISGRMSNIQWLSRLVSGDNTFKIQFYDLNAKFNVQVSKKDRLYLTIYTGQDQFKRKLGTGLSTFGISWDNM